MIRITAPRLILGASKFIGIQFRDGVAQVEYVHPEVEASLLQHRYTIERELVSTDEESPFEQLPDADDKPKVSKSRGRKASLTIEDEAPFAIVEMPDGTVIGDGESLATLQPDED